MQLIYKIRLAGLSVWYHNHSTEYKSTKAVKHFSDSAFLFKIDKDDISKVKNTIKMIDDESTSTEKWLTQGRHRQKRTTKALNFLFEWMKMKRFHRHIKYPGLAVTRESSQRYWWFRVKIRKLSERIDTLSHRIWLKAGFLRSLVDVIHMNFIKFYVISALECIGDPTSNYSNENIFIYFQISNLSAVRFSVVCFGARSFKSKISLI